MGPIVFFTAADACAMVAAGGGDYGVITGNGDIGAVALFTTADACAFLAAVGGDSAAGDTDIGAVALFAAADACAMVAAGGGDYGVITGDGGDGDIGAVALFAAADARALVAAVGGDGAAGDGDIGAIFAVAAADARGVAAAVGSDGAAGDGDVFTFLIVGAADARAVGAAGGGEAAHASARTVSNDQCATLALFYAGIVFSTGHGVGVFQLNGRGSRTVDGDSRLILFIFFRICVDSQVIQGDAGLAIGPRIDLDHISRIIGAVDVGRAGDDRRRIDIRSLSLAICNVVSGDRLSVTAGVHCDVALADVIGVCDRAERQQAQHQAQNEQQRNRFLHPVFLHQVGYDPARRISHLIMDLKMFFVNPLFRTYICKKVPFRT